MTILIILPNQLFNIKYLPKNIKKIILVEEPIYFGFRETKMNFNKLKLLLHRASMKYYFDYLKDNLDIKIEYQNFNKVKYPKKFITFKPYDYLLEKKLKCEYIENPNFILTEKDLEEYGNKDNYIHYHFYNFVKNKLNILKNIKSYDKENRLSLPNNIKIPNTKRINDKTEDKYIKEAKIYINKYFGKNYGNMDNFIFPITHKNSEKWLDNFIKNKLNNFGKYQDSINKDEPFLFHSVISPMLNIGLLNPIEIVDKIKKNYEKGKYDIKKNDFEGFIRQLIGWREYQRLLYKYKYKEMKNSNIFKNNNKLNDKWYKGNTNIPIIDHFIKIAWNYGYLHHIIRLMVISNFMNLCRINPNEVYKWFMEFSCDSYDWVMICNVYSMGLWSDKGIAMTKPYISTDNYIMKMSDFKEGEWNKIWKSLFYNFINNNKKIIKDTVYNRNLRYLIKKLNKKEKSELLKPGKEYLKLL
jgi:deoxyribodipyrimidine photolyase-related protein